MSAGGEEQTAKMSAGGEEQTAKMSAGAKSKLQMRRVALRAWVLCWLILVWMLLWGTVSAANILSGLAIALLITLLLPLPVVPIEGRVHPLSLLRLIVTVAYYLVLSSIQVAWLALKPGPPPVSAVLRAHLAIKSDLVLALAVNIVNLIPGSIALEIDQVRRMIYVHVIDVDSERAVNRFYRQVAEVQRLLVSTFEREADWRPAAREEADRA
jgi:multicomponent Na+:H+ antiporter subunit E